MNSAISSSKPLSRRGFLQLTALAATTLPSIVPAAVLGRGGKVAPSNRIVIGVIGSGQRGRAVLGGFLRQQDCQVRVICDVDRKHAEAGAQLVNNAYKNEDCVLVHDFREAVQRKDLDAFLVATPDHWHALNAVHALNAGKDVYVEKPLALTLEEGKAVRAAVRRRGRVF